MMWLRVLVLIELASLVVVATEMLAAPEQSE
jgi:hypothetical protein